MQRRVGTPLTLLTIFSGFLHHMDMMVVFSDYIHHVMQPDAQVQNWGRWRIITSQTMLEGGLVGVLTLWIVAQLTHSSCSVSCTSLNAQPVDFEIVS